MSEWISVKDRMPELLTSVVALKPCGPFVGFFSGKDWVVSTDRYNEVGITHWMPIPPPPEPKLTTKEALREAISTLDAAYQSSRGCRSIDLKLFWSWSLKAADLLPRLRSALESEEEA